MNRQSTHPLRLEVGQIWGNHYEIRRLLARGSVTEVYRAFSPTLKSELALKIMTFRPEDDARKARLHDRFMEAMQACTGLSHPNIGRIFDYGEIEGRYYIAMELIEGAVLRDVLSERRSGLPEERARHIFQQVADAVAYAHSKGVIHQDIRPGNIMLADDGERPVVIDFGMMGVLSGDEQSTAEYSPRAPLYMSPEQAAGGTVGPASDVYSLGILLYEMVTGDVPFKGSSAARVLVQHLQQEPRLPSDLNIQVDVAVETAIMRALAKRPEDRFDSPLSMVELIQHTPDPQEFDTVTLHRDSLQEFRQRVATVRKSSGPPPEMVSDNPDGMPRMSARSFSFGVLVGVLLVLVMIALAVGLLLTQGGG
ncbi:MAG: serine/threonine protein kinase [Anaerolineae bacterium]|nr:serine/threonine protein kinase [Anaerolineae bacterium]